MVEPAATRLLEEWKANNDLLKFHEDLKQKRFSYFLTIQTAFLAVFGLIAKDATVGLSMASLTAFTLISIPPLLIAHYFAQVDLRSRAYIDTFNTHLLLLEDEWKARFPDDHFSTYRELFAVLSRGDNAVIDKYVAARNLPGDLYPMLVRAKSAHRSEHAILRLFFFVWIVLLAGSTIVHVAWHVMNGSMAVT